MTSDATFGSVGAAAWYSNADVAGPPLTGGRIAAIRV